jgi:hypothetical protein
MEAYAVILTHRSRYRKPEDHVYARAHYIAVVAAANERRRLRIPLIDVSGPEAHHKGGYVYRAKVYLLRCGGRKQSKTQTDLETALRLMAKRTRRPGWVLGEELVRVPEEEAGAWDTESTVVRWNGNPVGGDWGPPHRSDVTPEEFVRAWVSSSDEWEVASRLGMSREKVLDRAEYYRKKGVKLRERPGYHPPG